MGFTVVITHFLNVGRTLEKLVNHNYIGLHLISQTSLTDAFSPESITETSALLHLLETSTQASRIHYHIKRLVIHLYRVT